MNKYQRDPADPSPYVPPFLPKRMKGASEPEILEAAENLRHYIVVMREIYKDLERSGKLTDVLAQIKQDRIESCKDELTIGYRRWLVQEAVLGDRRPIVVKELR